MRSRAGFAIPATAVGGIVLLLSCGDGAVEPAPPPAPVAATVTVNPVSATLTAIEETTRLTAEVRDQNGQVMSAVAIAWTSSDASIVAVDASGLVTAAANGSATITATAGSASGTAAVTVAQEVSAVSVAPATATLVAFGDTVRLVAEAADANGHAVADSEFRWESSDTLVAVVNDSGLVESLAAGEVTVTATTSGVTGAAGLTVVSPLPETVAVSPDTVRLTALGQTAQLAAEVRDQLGRVIEGIAVAWSSLDTLVASVNPAGLVTAAGLGETMVSATAGDASGGAVVAVTQSPGSVVVSPAEGRIGPGDTLRLVAEVFDANGNRVSGAAPAWSSSDATVARVDYSGLVTGVAEGTATISATAGTASGTATITVENPDRAALEALYRATDGPNWRDNTNWLTDAPLGEWTGVTTDEQGRVVDLSFGSNNFSGVLPPELGNLSKLEVLGMRGEPRLTGSIPPELARLRSLQWLSINTSNLTGEIPAELGMLSALEILDFLDNDLSGPIPPELGNLSRLGYLSLNGNNLTGEMPRELGNLGSMYWLSIADNQLTGEIPEEFGNLGRLERLWLQDNQLTGSIPPSLGNLPRLWWIWLSDNQLTGSIPPEFGNLTRLRALYLAGNRVSGAIPPELGRLKELEYLSLADNDLTGSVPAELSQASGLRFLILARNRRMSGVLRHELTDLTLDQFHVGETGLCAPADEAFQSWLRTIPVLRVPPCETPAGANAYLVQAVQSTEYPVALVAGEPALLRVFVTATNARGARMPAVRATFFQNGTEVHVANIDARATAIPSEVDEGSLETSANTEIPGSVIAPGLEMVVEVDPEGTLDPAVDIVKRMPETGRLAVDVQSVPALNLTVVPFINRQNPDHSIVTRTEGLTGDDPLFSDLRTLLPVADIRVSVHEPVWTNRSDAFSVLAEAKAIREAEGGKGHYLALMPSFTRIIGVADTPGWVAAAIPEPSTVAHELGHNMYLSHAPCGGAFGVDAGFPTADGSIGVWGYDFRSGQLVDPGAFDLMAYCGPRWISEYHFSNALRHRLKSEAQTAASGLAPVKSLLLWGGQNSRGEPFLEPAFVVEAAPVLPDSIGAYRVTGRNEAGTSLFSFSFAMPETMDGDGSSSFAFVLPVQPEWEGSLASITLTGPVGSATLDRESNRPVAILLNPQSGQVRGILRDPAPATLTAADAVGGAGSPRLRMLFSRGIPGAEAWRR